MFLLSLRLFQIQSIRLSPRLRSPALPSLPADQIARAEDERLVNVRARPVSCLQQVRPAHWHRARPSVTSEVRKRGLPVVLSSFLVCPATTRTSPEFFCQRFCVPKYGVFPELDFTRAATALLLLFEPCDCSEETLPFYIISQSNMFTKI